LPEALIQALLKKDLNSVSSLQKLFPDICNELDNVKFAS
jgi:hypothetical protein